MLRIALAASVGKASKIFTLELYNWGEAFFNPELPRLIEYAHRKRLVTLLSSNLSFPLKEDYVRAIIRSGLTHLTAAVDGTDQASSTDAVRWVSPLRMISAMRLGRSL